MTSYEFDKHRGADAKELFANALGFGKNDAKLRVGNLHIEVGLHEETVSSREKFAICVALDRPRAEWHFMAASNRKIALLLR